MVTIGTSSIAAIQGDITRWEGDVIVNAANSALAGGGGVDGAIHRAGGPAIMLELNRIKPRGGCPTGSAVITGAGRLKARFVVHAVGPVWRGGGFREADLLASAYASSLELAAEKGAATVAFPSISTGAYGYPVEKAAPVAALAAASFLRRAPGSVREIVFVLFDRGTLAAYQQALAGL